MEEQIRISVRELVAFSFFAPDIMPAAGLESMNAGKKAHKARQAVSEGVNEKSISASFHFEDLDLLLYGRMDSFIDGEVPFVEEMKLGYERLDEPHAEHRAQVVCYAAMVACRFSCSKVRFCVSYINEDGVVLHRFEEQMQNEDLLREVYSLLEPFARFAIREKQYRFHRDKSLRIMCFPFAEYRKGQRELAVQVYTAIKRKRRLFASLPTGTGKSVAVLFPALKALSEGKTDKILYLTARNTARQSPVNALKMMQTQGMNVRCSMLTAKEKLCPNPTRCHPDDCSRAKGHYIRQKIAVDELIASGKMLWDDSEIVRVADAHHLCPFEFALALTELADVVMMDLNYVFDPFAQVIRLAQQHRRCTLLVDEAHHTLERVRESLSGCLDSRELVRIRMTYGKRYGRQNDMYRALSAMIHALRKIPGEQKETQFSDVPEAITKQAHCLVDTAFLHSGEAGMQEVIRQGLSFLYASEHLNDDYLILLENYGKEQSLTLLCLSPGKEIARITKHMRGVVFFSATLNPLPAMKKLFGGDEEDACFSLPSPFPASNLCVIRQKLNTRFEQRALTAKRAAELISSLLALNPGNSIVFFPSYAYLEMVKAHLDPSVLPEMWVQNREMNEEDRSAFLEAFRKTGTVRLGLCVLGGLFSEGIDLPGDQLVNAVIIGVGLPVPSVRINALRHTYDQQFGDGFAYACQFPGMQKVLQAAGRVIRSETDRGVVMLLDDRYYYTEYEKLLPNEWKIQDGSLEDVIAQWRNCL